MKELKNHIVSNHEKQFCNLCVENENCVFPMDRKIYSTLEYQNHLLYGDDKGFIGHPLCQFCDNEHIYDRCKLFIHLSREHFQCHLCNQDCEIKGYSNFRYYKSYEYVVLAFLNWFHLLDYYFECLLIVITLHLWKLRITS